MSDPTNPTPTTPDPELPSSEGPQPEPSQPDTPPPTPLPPPVAPPETPPSAPPATPTPLKSPFSEEEARLRTQLYLTKRLDYQAEYYQKRSDEFNFNSDRMLYVSAGIMFVSTLVSSFSVVSGWPIWALITALLPAFAAGVSAFRSLYQWERQASLYDEAWIALQQARLTMPDEDYTEPGDYQRSLPQLVDQTEEILRGEAGQWGQINLAVKSGAQNGQTVAPPAAANGE
ncbi:SLATT domain-containing protein [Aggregatilinea lenta]|uniref:SLATT domain-containing protein n=1 Tax=Aggregatilinea lenta TaxID=913108 RepID=UPI000E5A6E97|nr:SLATT domain-containing protein [Aggregatilinea lenta]